MFNPPLTLENFEKICQKWATIFNANESGLEMWYPIGGAHLRIRQFFRNKNLQAEFFNKKLTKLLMVDVSELEDITFKDVETLFLQELGTKEVTINEYLSKNKQKINIFLLGFDSCLKNNKLDTLKQMGSLVQKFSKLSILLFTEINILDSSLYRALTTKSIFLQNISYQSLYTYEDSLQFFKYLGENWQCKFPQKTTELLARAIGGHFLLLKESARIMKANPNYSLEEILSASTLINKGLVVFNLLSEKDRETIINILLDKPDNNISEYLNQTKLVTDGKLGINYWYHIKEKILETINAPKSIDSLDLFLTSREKNIFDLLSNNKGLVSREKIAESIWQNEWEDKYSDWAIDQIIHRIREKLIKIKSPYKLLTKKGEGFILISQ